MNPFPLQNGCEELKKTLFQNAMKSNWKEVIKTYTEDEDSHTAKITSSGDTALHIAISNGEESVVESLVSVVESLVPVLCEAGPLEPRGPETTKGALETQNELGNTPLHLAAYLGNAEMCRCIAGCNSKLMGIRNSDHETPIFLAVRHGRKEAFQAMQEICKERREGYGYCRGKDGETILHAAIYGEYFDLAFDIMNHYDKLINKVNVYGFTPLHILANKPSAFRSGSQIRGFNKLIYHCIFVDELEHKSMHNHDRDLHQYKEGANYPENYHTCFTTSNLLWDVIRVLLGYSSKRHDVENTTQQKEKAEDETPQQDENLPKPCKQLIVNILCGNRKAEAERQQSKKVGSTKGSAQAHDQFLPKNYITFFNFIKLISKGMLVILGLGSKSVNKMKEKKSKHIWSLQIMEKLLDDASLYQYESTGKTPGIGVASRSTDAGTPLPFTLPPDTAAAADFDRTAIDAAHDDHHQQPAEPPRPPVETSDKESQCAALKSALESVGLVRRKASAKGNLSLDVEKRETPILIAAKSGVEEIVAGILERFPVAIHDMNSEKKNAVLLAVEHRQPHVYKLLLDRKMMKDTVFRKTDKDGNSALHLAARLGEYRPWLIPGAALQMQWEIKWYEFVKDSMPLHFFPRYNNESKTPRDIFTESHDALAKEGASWLTSTSQSCSVVAALIATVAFATSATVPGGVKSDNSGAPTLQNEPAFSIFAISSLIALCFSVTSVVMFLAILTSRFQEKDFGKDLPRKLLVGLTSLFISIGSMLLSFCAGHFFVLKNKLQYAAFPMYAITCLPVTFFAINQFPLYFDLVWATIRKVPQRSSK